MRNLFFNFLLVLFTTSVYANTFEIAHEAESIKIEYYDTSKTGKVFVKGCSHCSQSTYDFNSLPEISINGSTISFQEYLKSQRIQSLGTIVIDPLTNTITRINF